MDPALREEFSARDHGIQRCMMGGVSVGEMVATGGPWRIYVRGCYLGSRCMRGVESLCASFEAVRRTRSNGWTWWSRRLAPCREVRASWRGIICLTLEMRSIYPYTRGILIL